MLLRLGAPSIVDHGLADVAKRNDDVGLTSVAEKTLLMKGVV